jgi:hypothetical protein
MGEVFVKLINFIEIFQKLLRLAGQQALLVLNSITPSLRGK